VNIDSPISAAIRLLCQAKDNGGGIELRDIFGPAAEAWRSPDEIMARVGRDERLQWCLRLPALLEVRRDDTLVPPVWFSLTITGEALIDLSEVPSEFKAPSRQIRGVSERKPDLNSRSPP
jgi:hypothetical protein